MDECSNKLAVFLHLPKCGGKSLEQLLLKNYGSSNVIRIYRPDGQPIDSVMPKIPMPKAKSAALMYGHIPYGTGEKIGRNCDYFTVLRDSTSRFLSFYRYVKYDFVHHPLHGDVKSGRIGISDLCSRNKHLNIRNVMTKLLAGYETRDREQSFMLQEAKDHLDFMPAFGLTKHYAESIRWLADVFGWDYRELGNINVSTVSDSKFKDKGYISDIEIQRVREMNWMDEELYHYAEKKFLNRQRN